MLVATNKRFADKIYLLPAKFQVKVTLRGFLPSVETCPEYILSEVEGPVEWMTCLSSYENSNYSPYGYYLLWPGP